jgi:hypothetical protein
MFCLPGYTALTAYIICTLFLLGEPGIVRVNVGWGEFSFRNRVA